MRRKPKSKEKIEQEKEESKRMTYFFLYCWKVLPRKSEVSGKQLLVPNKAHYHHVWEKSTHPELAYSISNILVVTLDEHFKLNSDLEFFEEAKNKRKFVNQNLDNCIWESKQWLANYEKYINGR